MRAALKPVSQVEIGGLETPESRAIQIEASRLWRERLWSAMRQFVIGYIDAGTNLKGYDGCAYRLNEIWEEEGRSVTAGSLRAALTDTERNHFRLEWVDWFASQSPEIAEMLARRVKPKKTDRELLDAFLDELLEDIPHKRIQAALRRAAAR